jgi:hypothetical protein
MVQAPFALEADHTNWYEIVTNHDSGLDPVFIAHQVGVGVGTRIATASPGIAHHERK